MDTSEKLAWTPSVEDVRALFFYDFNTGHLTRRSCLPNSKSKNEHLIGKSCTCSDGKGYLITSIRKKLYRVHRLVWFYVHGVWPINDIDHVNGNRSDNRIENLREATRGANGQNRTVRNRNNTSGHPGVYWDKAKGKWCAEIKIKRKKISLGVHTSKESAIAARMEGKRKYHTFDSTERSVKSA